MSIIVPLLIHTGVALAYNLLAIAIWWIFYTTALFYAVFWPFRAQSFKKSHKLKYVYVACIVAGLSIPLVPVIAAMADFSVRVKSDEILSSMNVTFESGGLGFANGRFPPAVCGLSNGDITFFALALPINIIVIIGVMELILIFWNIHKVRSYNYR